MRHGGDLAAAEAEFGKPAAAWLDLSTGVNPFPYPLSAFSERSLTTFPQQVDLDALHAVAREAYGWAPQTQVVAGPGAQALIQLLPYLRMRRSVVVAGPTYGEHAYLWARAGHSVREIRSLAEIRDADVVVVVNPNTPSGRAVAPRALLRIAQELKEREGLLVVDEAYADAAPDLGLGALLPAAGVVALRSLGKFFGLPGIRLGFAAGDPEMVNELASELGPWPVSGPAIEAGRAALADGAWIASMRLRLSVEAMRLDELLTGAGFSVIGGADLFRTVRHARAADIHAALARAGVWTRRYEGRAEEIRFGLPGGDAAFDRLAEALKAAVREAV